MDNPTNSKKGTEQSVNILDIFFYLLSYWYLFLIGAIVCGGLAAYRYATASFTYSANASIMIKSPSEQISGARLDTYTNLVNKVNMKNEILEFRSKELMTRVVKHLGADVNYMTKVRFRMIELYNSTPVTVQFIDLPESATASMTVIPVDDKRFQVSSGTGSFMTARLDDTIMVNGNRVVISGTPFYTNEYFGHEIRITKENPILVAKRILSRLSIVQTDEKAYLLDFTLRDSSPRRACDILNYLFVQYDNDAVEHKKQAAMNTANIINERLRLVGDELSDTEQQLQQVQTETRIISADGVINNYLEKSNQSAAAIEQVDRKLRLANYLRDYIQQNAQGSGLIITNTGLEDANIEGLINSYNEQRLKIDQLLTGSSNENPVIKEMNLNLVRTKDNILRNIDNLIDNLTVRRAEFEDQEAEQFAKFTSMPQTVRQMLSIERQQSIKESLYMYLLNKREENALAQSLVDNNVRVIDAAESTGVHITPSRNSSILFGLLLGLLIPAVILIARLFLDNKVHSRKEIEQVTHVPFIGEVPLISAGRRNSRKDNHRKLSVYYNRDGYSVLTESLRMLCTNVDFLGETGSRSKVITVSSFMERSGKTFVLLNMAACFADNSKKVILVDLDLRKRSLSRSLGATHGISGVSNYLVDSGTELDSIVINDVIPGVDLIPAGVVPPNPVELLRRKRLDAMIDELRKRYDIILLDNVPADMVADALVTNRVVDTTLFIVRAGQIDRRMLGYLDEIYDSGKLNNLGIILNGSEVKGHYSYRYGYGYGYGQGYGYGYGRGYSYGHAYGELESKKDKD